MSPERLGLRRGKRVACFGLGQRILGGLVCWVLGSSVGWAQEPQQASSSAAALEPTALPEEFLREGELRYRLVLEAPDWAALAEACRDEGWQQRASALGALARAGWLYGWPESTGLEGGAEPGPLHGMLADARRDAHPSVRAAAWNATWAAGLRLDTAELLAAAEEPLFEARLAAARLAGPGSAADASAAQRLARDHQPEVRAAAQAALIDWAGRDGGAAATAWVEGVWGRAEASQLDLQAILAGFERLERQRAWGRPAARALVAALQELEAPNWLLFPVQALAVEEPIPAQEVQTSVAAWLEVQQRSARLGALLARQARRLGPDFGAALLAAAAQAQDANGCDGALAALGPYRAAQAIVDLAGTEAFRSALERARGWPLVWREDLARRAYARLGAAEAELLMSALEAARGPLPRLLLLEWAGDGVSELAPRAFGLLLRRLPQLEPILAEIHRSASSARQLLLEQELPRDQAWPAFLPAWLERGERLPEQRPELAARLARAGGRKAREHLERWYLSALAVANGTLSDGRADPAHSQALSEQWRLLEALNQLDGAGAQARLSERFVALEGSGSPLLPVLARGLLAAPEGRALVALWLAAGPRARGRAGRELAADLLQQAAPVEFATRAAAIEFLGEALLLLPAVQANELLAALVQPGEPRARYWIERAAGEELALRREAAATCLASCPEPWALKLLQQLAGDRDFGVQRAAVHALLKRSDSWPVLEALLARWSANGEAPQGQPLEALEELRFLVELWAVDRGVWPPERLNPAFELGLTRAAAEFQQLLDFPASEALRYQPTLAALSVLCLAEQPVIERSALLRQLAPLPCDVLQRCLLRIPRETHGELELDCLRLALLAGLGEGAGPRDELSELAALYWQQAPSPASLRLLAQCSDQR